MSESRIRSRHIEIIKGGAVYHYIRESPDILQEINKLWPPKGIITHGEDNFFVVIFESWVQQHIIALAKLVQTETGDGKAIGNIYNVVTAEDYQDQDLAKLLISKLKSFGEENKFSWLEVTCNPAHEEANHLYQKAGFTLVATACGEKGVNLYRYFYE